jgi:hypothetical protein
MAPRDEIPREEAPCDGLVAGPLVRAQESLRHLLTAEAETLVTILGWVEVALECSLEPQQRKNVRQHCQQALRLVEAIERRHRDGGLPEPVNACLGTVRKSVSCAIRNLDSAPS